MEEDDDFEQGEDLQTNSAIYFLKMLFSINKCLQRNYNQQDNSSVAAASQRQNNIRPTKLSIEPFDRDPQHFLEFWDSFCNSVHENDSISNVQKMT